MSEVEDEEDKRGRVGEGWRQKSSKQKHLDKIAVNYQLWYEPRNPCLQVFFMYILNLCIHMQTLNES
jgi:hypothetical protein